MLPCEQVVEAAGNVLTACASALGLEVMLPAMGKALTSMKAVRPRLGILQFFVSQASRCHQPAESSTLPMRYAIAAFRRYKSTVLLQCMHQKPIFVFFRCGPSQRFDSPVHTLAAPGHDKTQLMVFLAYKTLRRSHEHGVS